MNFGTGVDRKMMSETCGAHRDTTTAHLCQLGRDVSLSPYDKRPASRQMLSVINLSLCVPCIISQCVNDKRDAQFL